jgi:hypothetical protein
MSNLVSNKPHPFLFFFIGVSLVFFGASGAHPQTYLESLFSACMMLCGCISCAYGGAFFKEFIATLHSLSEKST